MPGQTNASVVTMLDVSDSMASVIPFVIIDGKAFVRAARPGDQIAVIKFSDDASMVYPTTQAFTTEDPQRTISAAAAAAIQGLTSQNMTNIGAAVTIANNIIATAANSAKAYVLLSDGYWNRGTDPNTLPLSAPIYICGLGPSMQRSYVSGMLEKSSSSQYIASPGPVQMMQVFNQIRGLADDAMVPANQIDSYSGGTDYVTTPVTVSATTDDVQFTVVWSTPCSYTSGAPDPTHINITLVDPSGTTTSDQPVVADPGYAIFEPSSPAPGQWTIVAQYSLTAPINGTSAGFEFDTVLKLGLTVPDEASGQEPVTLRADMTDDGEPVEKAQVTARIMAPQFDVDELLDRHQAAIDERLSKSKGMAEEGRATRVGALREHLLKESPGSEPFPYSATFIALGQADDGAYEGELGPTPLGGNYTVEVTAKGYASRSKTPFQRKAMATVAVDSGRKA